MVFDFFAAQIILNLLNDDDQLMLLAISNTIHITDNPSKFLPMNAQGKRQLRKIIESLERDAGTTNHSLAFETAFEWIRFQADSGNLSLDDKSVPLQILYVSRGLVPELSETEKSVLNVIATGQSRLKYPIVINTCAIILGELFCTLKIWLFICNYHF